MVARFLGMDIISGTFILNKIYNILINLPKHLINISLYLFLIKYRVEHEHWIFKHEFKMDFFIFGYIKRRFLLY